MKLLVGWGLDGPSFTGCDASAVAARLGEPAWGPAALMRDLELRLGIAPSNAGASVRVPRWATRIKALADARAFYAASFAVDAIGTAECLLAWRDALVEAGWTGEAIPEGGERLDALAAIEKHDAEPLPAGRADRLVQIERELYACRARFYERIDLIEERAVWSRRWQRIFDRLEAVGTTIEVVRPSLPGARGDTDLGLLQSVLRDNTTVKTSATGGTVRGDGSLLVLRGETPAELGELVAALLRRTAERSALVVRCLDAAPLESALERYGLPSQGYESMSAWRPATQLLPLAIELAFEPRDPYRVLELLTLPVGPFRGRLGAMLARAVARQPGIGGQEWVRRKAEAEKSLHESHARLHLSQGKSESEAQALAATYVGARMQRVVEWLETPGASMDGVLPARLLEITGSVRAWLQPQAAPDAPDASVYRAAYVQAKAFTEALMNHSVETLTRQDVRHLFDTVARGAEGHPSCVEQAGRHAHVSHPSAVVASSSTIIFWNFVSGTERRPRSIPWNSAERQALHDAGVILHDPVQLLAVEADAWRRAILAARDRVAFVVPRTHKGSAMAAHPLWDEIVARLGIDEDPAAISRLTRDVATVLRGDGAGLVTVATLPVLALPDAPGIWHLPPDVLTSEDARGTSATAIQTLVSCPFAWVLEHRANLRFGAVAKVAGGPLLNGNLSHRLVEELFNAGAFDLKESAFLARVDATLQTLVRTEGATLLLQGSAFEYAQVSRQIRRAMRELHRYLRASGYKIAGVEELVGTKSTAGAPHGRLDVRLVDKLGKDAVLDLKWGAATYRGLLETGRAVQLAVYSVALGVQKGRASIPAAAYFAISSAKVLTADGRMNAETTIDGISLDETWSRVERTRAAVRASLNRGEVPVANTRRALALLEQLGVPEDKRSDYYQADREAPCQYCSFSNLCGRAWEEFQ